MTAIERRHDDPRSLLPRGDRPVELNPVIEAQRHIDATRAAIDREIAALRKILSRRGHPDATLPARP